MWECDQVLLTVTTISFQATDKMKQQKGEKRKEEE